MSQGITELDPDELDALIQRVQEAKQHRLALSPEDCQLLLDALLSLATLHSTLEERNVTITKLRKLTGIVASSETLKSQVSGQQGAKASSDRQGRKSRPKAPPVKPKVCCHALTDLKAGETCPECQRGRLRKYEPATFLRITGHSPFTPEQHVMERLRCNTCGAYFTAELPDEVKADGQAGQKYGFSARSLMALGKSFMGNPYYRQGSLQDMLGVSVSASTIFDQTEYVANALAPVQRYLVKLAATAELFYIDDTRHRILAQQPELRQSRDGKGERVRTGVYCSGLIAVLPDGNRITLFQTSLGHAGEFIDSILAHRPQSLAAPTVMSDALSSNRPTVCPTRQALCNAHARRQFFDLEAMFPDIVTDVIQEYGRIWTHERETQTQQLPARERQRYHHQHSLPVMSGLRQRFEHLLSNDEVEENGSLGKAMGYYLKHYDGLTAFCRTPGVALDNNLMEAQLKLVVRNRKNAMFHKTLAGAAILDTVTSIVATGIQAGINLADYITRIQREAESVQAHPERYLPWCRQDE